MLAAVNEGLRIKDFLEKFSLQDAINTGAKAWNYGDKSMLKVLVIDMTHNHTLIMRKIRQTQIEGHFTKYLTNTPQQFQGYKKE